MPLYRESEIYRRQGV
ncbi:hypothetical protein [Escherichia coli]|nr:hypothetical protein [Veillonella sp.]